MPAEERLYRCLRCGHEYREFYDTKWGPVELTCSKCRSNSVRRMPKPKPENPVAAATGGKRKAAAKGEVKAAEKGETVAK